MKKLLLPLFAFLLVFVSGCSEEPKPLKPVVDSVIADHTGHPEISCVNGFCISSPKHFKQVDHLNLYATLQFSDEENEEYYIVIEDSIPLFLSTHPMNQDVAYKHMSELSFYANVKMQELASNLKIVGNPEMVDENSPGVDKKATSFHAKFSGIDAELSYRIVFIKTKARFFTIMCWTLADHEIANGKELDDILRSFHEM